MSDDVRTYSNRMLEKQLHVFPTVNHTRNQEIITSLILKVSRHIHFFMLFPNTNFLRKFIIFIIRD